MKKSLLKNCIATFNEPAVQLFSAGRRSGLVTALVFASMLAQAQNVGFENGTSSWTASGPAGYSASVNTASGYVRSGLKSLALSSPASATFTEMRTSAGYSVTVPASGTNYVTVIAYVMADGPNSQAMVGAVNNASGVKVQSSVITASTSAFQRITHTFLAQNGQTYSPVLYGRKSSGMGGSSILFFDDVVIYTSTQSTADLSNPTILAEGIKTQPIGTELPLTWTPGSDGGSGVTGALVLRQSGLTGANLIPKSQTLYSTDPTVGPTSISGWEVVGNTNDPAAISDDPGAMGAYTYLIYMRDKALNYSQPSRMFVVNDAYQSITLPLFATLNLDGLYLAPDNELEIPVGMNLTLRPYAEAIVYGTVINNDNITLLSDAVLSFEDGSVYEHMANQANRSVPSAVWDVNSTCIIKGVTSNPPYNLSQTFGNFLWDCPDQTISSVVITGATYDGTFTLANTGSGGISIGNSYNSFRGNFVQSGGLLHFSGTSSELIFNGPTLQTITFTGGSITGIVNLTVNKSNQLRLLNNFAVSGHLKLLNGVFNLNTRQLSLASGTAITRASGSLTGGVPVFSGNHDLTYLATVIAGSEMPAQQNMIRNLTLNCNGMVTLSNHIWVNGTLDFQNGRLVLGNRNLTISTSGDLTGYSSTRYVVTNGNGELKIDNLGIGGRTGTVWFPVGRTTSSYTPVSVKNQGVADQFSVRVINGCFNNYTVTNGVYQTSGSELLSHVVRKTYFISEAVPGGSLAELSVQWNTSDEGEGFNAASSYLSHYVMGTGWDKDMPKPAESPNTSTRGQSRNLVSNFSPFSVGDDNSPLPVELVYFRASLKAADVQLSWLTASELENDRFEIERSADAKTWETIGRVQGAGTTENSRTYSYTDAQAGRNFSGTLYYRLRQVDLSGESSLSAVAAVTIKADARPVLQLLSYQPGARTVQVQAQPETGQTMTVLVLDMKGTILYSQRVSDSRQLQFDLGAYAEGAYTILGVTQGGSFPIKFMAY